MRIEVENLHFSYGKHKVLDGLSFVIEPNEVTAILGVSGGGKSTLLKLLAGLKKPDEGKILYGENGIDKIEAGDLAYIFQDSTLLPWKTVRKNIELANRKNANVDEIAEKVGLLKALDKYPDELSGGMKQRVEFGRVLARSPKLLFMDEPFSSLDVQFRDHLQEVFIKIQEEQQFTSIFVTHNVEEAIKVSDHLKILTGNPVNVVSKFKNDKVSANRLVENIKLILKQDFQRLEL